MRPISPTRTMASGKGTKLARGGPRTNPAMISPTSAGMPIMEVRIPRAVASMRKTKMASVVLFQQSIKDNKTKNVW